MKKTSNTQRRTLNIEWSADGFCRETPTEEYRNNKTPPKYDLEDRLLDFAVNIVELPNHCPTRDPEITLQANFCGAERRRSPIMARLKQRNHGRIFFTS